LGGGAPRFGVLLLSALIPFSTLFPRAVRCSFFWGVPPRLPTIFFFFFPFCFLFVSVGTFSPPVQPPFFWLCGKGHAFFFFFVIPPPLPPPFFFFFTIFLYPRGCAPFFDPRRPPPPPPTLTVWFFASCWFLIMGVRLPTRWPLIKVFAPPPPSFVFEHRVSLLWPSPLGTRPHNLSPKPVGPKPLWFLSFSLPQSSFPPFPVPGPSEYFFSPGVWLHAHLFSARSVSQNSRFLCLKIPVSPAFFTPCDVLERLRV